MSTPATALLTARTYTIPEAARLAHTSSANVRRWLFGDERPGHGMEPVLGKERKLDSRISFLDLAEIIVVASFRRKGGKGIPIDRFRRARAYAKKHFGIDHLFATQKFAVEGGHILHDFELAEPGPGKLALDLNGTWTLPIGFNDALELFEFQPDGVARLWYPRGRRVPIILDPSLGAGRPVIAGSNVRVEVLEERLRAKWTIDEIADDFELDRATVEAALQDAA